MYGLAVYGAGIATFVDSAFVGSGPVEVVVESSGVGRGKAVAQQDGPGLMQWSLEDVDLLDPDRSGLCRLKCTVIEQTQTGLSAAGSEIGFAHQNDFLVCEVSVPGMNVFRVSIPGHEALGKDGSPLVLAIDVILLTRLGSA